VYIHINIFMRKYTNRFIRTYTNTIIDTKGKNVEITPKVSNWTEVTTEENSPLPLLSKEDIEEIKVMTMIMMMFT
jgi:hypothetical protein